jgi:plastocyanin
MGFLYRRCGGMALLTIGILVALTPGCSDSPPEPARKAETTPIDPATVGEISVTVSYRGDVPPPKQLVMSSAPQCALAHEGPVFDEALIVGDGHLKNAIVWIDKGLERYSFPTSEKPVIFDQKGCIYQPRVGVAMVGQPVEFVNSDAEPHNVHGFPKMIDAWNFMLSRQGSRRKLTFAKPEIGVLVGCDIHPWMRAYLGITAHPYAAVTSADGKAILQGVPAGEYSVGVWHEVLGRSEKQVRVVARESAQLAFEFGG